MSEFGFRRRVWRYLVSDDVITLEPSQALTLEYAAMRSAQAPDGAFAATLADRYVQRYAFELPITEDEVPKPPKVPVTQPGDIWLLGEHRLLCGDSTRKDAVNALVAGDKIDAIFTDPPYGMRLNTNFDSMHKKGSAHRVTGDRFLPVFGDDTDYDASHIFEQFGAVPEVLLWGADYYRRSLPDGGSWFVWDKRCDENMDKVIGNVFELCWSKKAHKREVCRMLWSGHHGMATDDTRSRVHPTQKPAALARWFFERIKGDVMLDLFAGSGSTIVACEQTGRRGLAVEIDPAYCDVIVTRWEKLTGKKGRRA